MDLIFTQLSSSLSTAQTIEQLVCPILDMLGSVTGMESTYLTSIDLDLQTQYVSFANNKDKLQIPEGLTVPWQDTLCRRALESGTLATDCVPRLWADSLAASELGIRSYVSAPIRSSSGDVLGTLCTASTGQHAVSAQVQALCQLFASIVSNFIEREILVEQLKVANEQLASYALTDLLTGLPNRRAMFDELEHLFAQGRRNHHTILVGVIDLDGFKLINDQFGHQGGDSFLQGMAQRLSTGLRAGDRVGRLGGDEFLFIGPGPRRRIRLVLRSACDSACPMRQPAASAWPGSRSAMPGPVSAWWLWHRICSASRRPFHWQTGRCMPSRTPARAYR